MTARPVLVMLSLDALSANPGQPRKEFSGDELADLAESINQVGLLQPILARPLSQEGTYQIVAGERRARAARLAGLTDVPVLVWDSDEKHAFLLAVVENTSRADLTPLEEAAAYQVLEDDLGLTHEQIASRVGRSRQHVGNMLRLLRLPLNVQRLLAEGLVTAGHARALLPVRDPFACYLLAQRTSTDGLSVREVEDIVRNGRYYGAEGLTVRNPRPHHPRPTPAVQDLAQFDDLADWLETKVTESRPHGATPGRLHLHYADAADRARILAILFAAASRDTHSSRPAHVQ